MTTNELHTPTLLPKPISKLLFTINPLLWSIRISFFKKNPKITEVKVSLINKENQDENEKTWNDLLIVKNLT